MGDNERKKGGTRMTNERVVAGMFIAKVLFFIFWLLWLQMKDNERKKGGREKE